jgi:protein-disulfide isomerase
MTSLLKGGFERLSSGLLTVSAVAIAFTFAHREFGGRPEGQAPVMGPPTYVADWQSLVRIGHAIGDSLAPIKVVEFGDFECPFCRSADTLVRRVMRSRKSSVSLIFVDYPLRMHRFALPAARAAECAASQGRFSAFHDRLFERQDSLGLKTWVSFAEDAGVRDTAAFARCVTATSAVPFVQAGLAAGDRLGIRGTPTFLINGWRLASPPSSGQQLDSLITALASKPGKP